MAFHTCPKSDQYFHIDQSLDVGHCGMMHDPGQGASPQLKQSLMRQSLCDDIALSTGAPLSYILCPGSSRREEKSPSRPGSLTLIS